MTLPSRRALLLVLDSVGIGHAPDAAAYGDEGADTFGHILAQHPHLAIPHLRDIGIESARALAANRPAETPRRGGAGCLTERSAGKDTTTGHWEIAGTVLAEPFPVFETFPPALVAAIEAEAGVSFLGNYAASGTAILDALGEEHLHSGRPILYTSADSVLQIAAHEGVMPPEALYGLCEIARRHAPTVGRVIARPFTGSPGAWTRTPRRRDFSLTPPPNILNRLVEHGVPTCGIGKIHDIFAGSGLGKSISTKSNADGMRAISELWNAGASGLLFANLVDFDMLFGHRRDVAGYARALEEFDEWLGGFLPGIRPGEDLVIITADHGNDPAAPRTDHTRERVPLLVPSLPTPCLLGSLAGYDHIAHMLADYFGLTTPASADSNVG